MNKKILFSTLLLSVIALAGCSKPNNGNSESIRDDYKLSFIAPSGAPTIAFYDAASEGMLTTNSVPANVGAQLQNDLYDGVVFDFYNGLKSIKNNQCDYELVRIITGGNFYLVGFNKEKAPTKDDYIVSFGQNLLPDLVYKSIYGEEIAAATKYVNGVADIGGIMESGLHNGNQVDYVLVAQPVLFSKLSSSPIKSQLKVVASLRDEWFEKTGQTAIPQAGLFINKTKYSEHTSVFNGFLDEFEDAINTCIEDPATMKAGIESVGDVEAQKALFGFTSTVAYNVQKDNANGFALVSSEDHAKLNIQDFLNALGKTQENYDDYINLY